MNKNITNLILHSVFDFLFPVDPKIKKLQETPAQILLDQLPASESFSGDSSTNINTLFSYGDERVKNLVWEIKYYKNQKISDAVGELIAEKIKSALGPEIFKENHLVIPIPLTKKRLRERGFNHTEMLTQSVVKHLPENFTLATNIVEKIRHTPKQSSLENRSERLHNLVGAFRVSNPEKTKGQKIILIDDVVTTGATVHEVQKVLLNASAAYVVAFAIAH